MTIELYKASTSNTEAAVDSPISNVTGELPEQEPALDPDNLLGSFDTQDEVLAFVNDQLISQNQHIVDSRISSFSAYTHVELLVVTIRNENQSTRYASYYLVNDEGY